MPYFVLSPRSPLMGFLPEGFNCIRKTYHNITDIPEFNVSGQVITYASPDSTYAVTKRLLDSAKKEILIGIYDFDADYIKELLLNALERKVQVTLMLDVNSTQEVQLLKDLSSFGCKTVSAPSCQNKLVRYFPNCHEKFVVIDDEWLMVQSGNYSKNSIPFNEEDGGDPKHFKKGNRDMGVAIQSKEMSAFFKKVLLSDIKLVEDGVSPESLLTEAIQQPLLVDAVPEQLPIKLFPSKTFSLDQPMRVVPILSPDNYMDKIVALLKSAKKSIYIENQYIKSTQPDVSKLLDAIADARDKNADLDVKIILGKLFSNSDVPKEKANLQNLESTYNLKLGTHIKYIDISRFVHCHNKLIIIDGENTLISSQNWSDTAVSQNREAGLILYNKDIAGYYNAIFQTDWETGWDKIAVSTGDSRITPETLSKGNFTRVNIGDYEEV